jgi:beta-glucosidase/6-phospho-beta-glucosidase/beta-galactosidase
LEKRCSFRSFFLGGFECSTQKLRDGRRLDQIAATRHDEFVARDYQCVQQYGMRTVRDGIRWHLIEKTPGRYDWSSALPMIRAARAQGVQVIWDLFHYGWPDDIDVFSAAFVDRFERFARAFARMYASEFGSNAELYVCPTNEISFLSWGGGEVACLNPFARGRGFELKRQIVRANVAAIEAVWEHMPRARVVQIDPAVHITADPATASAEQVRDAERHRQYMFQAWDMIAGRVCPELGGRAEYLDIVGVNYYVQNQWLHEQHTIYRGHPLYRPLAMILEELWQRYRRPLFIAETGIEDDLRAPWLRYVCDEAADALRMRVPVEGVCLYPVVNYPGWDDARHCYNGLLDYCDDCGERQAHAPLAEEIVRQDRRMTALWESLTRDTRVHEAFV